MTFTLDPRVESSSFWIEDLPLSQVRLKNDRRFPWIVLIPRRLHISELFELTTEDQQQLWVEIVQYTQHLHTLFLAHKMNVEILGNKVRQLHIHIIARFETDVAWPESVLSSGSSQEYTSKECEEIITRLRTQLR